MLVLLVAEESEQTPLADYSDIMRETPESSSICWLGHHLEGEDAQDHPVSRGSQHLSNYLPK
jgi:hypothetical protein